MRTCNGGSLSNHQEVLIKRYYEIHFDYSTEFKNTSVGKSTYCFRAKFLSEIHSTL